MSGVREWNASTTAGWNSAAAVPDVESSTTGLPVALARPTPKNEPDRSSICTKTFVFGCRCNAIASAADREPGDTHAYSTPCTASSSTNVAANDCATSIGLSRGRAGHASARLHAQWRELGRAGRESAWALEMDRAQPPRPRQ